MAGWDELGGKMPGSAGQGSSSVEGAVDYDTLMDMYTQSTTGSGGVTAGSSLGNYLGQEFGLSADELKYITPLDQTGLEMLAEKLDLDLDTIRNVYAETVKGSSMTAGQSLAEMQGNMQNRMAASGLATSGQEAFRAGTTKEMIQRTYGQDMSTAQLGKKSDIESKQLTYGASKFDEEQRLLNQFYSDVSGIKQLQAQQSGGGKK